MNPSLTVTFPLLHEAALNGHVHCLEILTQMGADPEKSVNQFGTALDVEVTETQAANRARIMLQVNHREKNQNSV